MSSHLEGLPSITGNLGNQVMLVNGLPAAGAYQVLVTGADGRAVWGERTHYPESPAFDISWDGSTAGRDTVDMTPLGYDGLLFAKVSDAYIPLEKLPNAVCRWNNGGEDIVEESGIDTESWPGVYAVNSEVLIVHDEDAINALLAEVGVQVSKGVYFLAIPADDAYIARFTGEQVIHRLDEKYLPDIDYLRLINRPEIHPDPVRYDNTQALTERQMGIARKNIDAVSKDEMNERFAGFSALPAVNEDDNGKFLRVVDGAWAKMTIPSAEEAVFGG